MRDPALGAAPRARKPWPGDPVLVEITPATELPDHFPGAAALRAAGHRTWLEVMRMPSETLVAFQGTDARTAREPADEPAIERGGIEGWIPAAPLAVSMTDGFAAAA